MTLSPRDILTKLQWDFLSRFFQESPPFFLTGGTALSAFYLRHRYSEDLDLFSLDGAAFDRVPLYIADRVESRAKRQFRVPGFVFFPQPETLYSKL